MLSGFRRRLREGAIEVLEAQREGKRPMPAEEIARDEPACAAGLRSRNRDLRATAGRRIEALPTIAAAAFILMRDSASAEGCNHFKGFGVENLVRVMADNWWVPLLRGIAAVIFGLMALIWPGLTVYLLLLVFGAYAIFDGIMSIIVGFQRKSGRRRLVGIGRWTGRCRSSSA